MASRKTEWSNCLGQSVYTDHYSSDPWPWPVQSLLIPQVNDCSLLLHHKSGPLVHCQNLGFPSRNDTTVQFSSLFYAGDAHQVLRVLLKETFPLNINWDVGSLVEMKLGKAETHSLSAASVNTICNK